VTKNDFQKIPKNLTFFPKTPQFQKTSKFTTFWQKISKTTNKKNTQNVDPDQTARN
jgi:hypothetical protein